MPESLRSALWATCLSLLAFAAPFAAVAKTPPRGEDTLTATLAGEFALQSGRLDDAARWYLDAARGAQGDAGLAERATRIALLADDQKLASAALDLWGNGRPMRCPCARPRSPSRCATT